MIRASAISTILACLAPACSAAGESQPASYCGIRCVARAAQGFGISITFADLVRPEYLSDRSGSTADDLVRALADKGLQASVRQELTCFVLQCLDGPAILHVKKRPGAPTFDHWVLFAGTDGGKAKVFDGDGPAQYVEFGALGESWDGVAVLIDSSPSRIVGSWLAGYLLVGGLFATLLAGIHCGMRKLAPTTVSAAPWARLGLEGLGLILVTLGALSAVWLLSPDGFLNDPGAIEAVQAKHLASFLPHGSTVDVVRATQAESETLLVDARSAGAFAAGHIPRATSMPYDLADEVLDVKLQGVAKDTPVLVYCESSGCHFSAFLARRLMARGYANIRLYRDGWQGWVRYESTRPRAAGAAPKPEDRCS